VEATGVLALGAALSWTVARRRGGTASVAIWASGAPAAVALVLTAGSLGQSLPGPGATLLFPSLGLLPAGVAAGVLGVELLAWLLSRIAGRRGGRSALASPETPGSLIDEHSRRRHGGARRDSGLERGSQWSRGRTAGP
jgi:hypothetical protein